MLWRVRRDRDWLWQWIPAWRWCIDELVREGWYVRLSFEGEHIAADRFITDVVEITGATIGATLSTSVDLVVVGLDDTRGIWALLGALWRLRMIRCICHGVSSYWPRIRMLNTSRMLFL